MGKNYRSTKPKQIRSNHSVREHRLVTDAKRKFSEMLDDAKEEIYEDRTNYIHNLKESAAALLKRSEEEALKAKESLKRFKSLNQEEKLLISLQAEIEQCKIPKESGCCDKMNKKRLEIEQDLAARLNMKGENN